MTNLEAAARLTQMYADFVRQYGSDRDRATAVAMAIMALKENKDGND